MPTINLSNTSSTDFGRGRTSPLFSAGGRANKVAMGTFDFDSSYPTGGESIADIYNLFRSCDGVVFQATDGTRLYAVDHAAQKVKAFTALATEVANATNLSAVTGIRWFAWGIG
jgi:hypothetical protein